MSVEISPQELAFHRPFTVEGVENLKIKNSTAQPIAFKVKTTAPKQYCVRPNSGRVEPNREVQVQVILQAMKQEPPQNTKCKDKFLVQSVAITPDKDFTNLASIWDTIEKSSVQEKKIRVVLLDFDGSSNPESTIMTPTKSTTTSAFDATPDTAPPAYSSQSDRVIPQSESRSSSDGSAGLAAAAAVVTTTSSEPSREELKRQLVEAEKMIAMLKQDNSGLRQRKPANTSSAEETSSPMTMKHAEDARPVEGVPIMITAVLCLVSFLLAFAFF